MWQTTTILVLAHLIMTASSKHLHFIKGQFILMVKPTYSSLVTQPASKEPTSLEDYWTDASQAHLLKCTSKNHHHTTVVSVTLVTSAALDTISSLPVRVCFCKSESEPDCSYQPPTIKVKKRRSFHCATCCNGLGQSFCRCKHHQFSIFTRWWL